MPQLPLLRPALPVLLALAATLAMAQSPPEPAGAQAREARLLKVLSPQARRWVNQEARREVASNSVSYAAAERAIASAGPGDGLAGRSVEDLILLVFMEVSRDAERELDETLADMERSRARRQAQREAAGRQKSAQAATRDQAREVFAALEAPPRRARSAQVDAYLASRHVHADAIAELSVEQQLRLERAMDRLSKASSAATNLMKKAAQTQDGVIQDLR